LAREVPFPISNGLLRHQGNCLLPIFLTPSFHFANTPPEIDRRDAQAASASDGIGPALLSNVDPPSPQRLPNGLEGSWRIYNGRKYFIVLNKTDQAMANQVIKLRGVGAATSAR